MGNAAKFLSWVALFLSFGSVSWSDQPTPTPTVEVQPIQPKAELNPNQSDINKQGTEKNPIIVKILEAPKTEAETAQNAKDHEEKAASDQRLGDLTDKIAKFTGGLVIVGFLQACVLVWQAGLLAMTIRASKAAERARVYVDVKVLSIAEGPENGHAEVTVNVKFSNHGRTAATLRQLRAYMQVVNTYPNKLIEFEGAQREIPAGKSIKGDGGDWTTIVEQKISMQDWTNVVFHNAKLICLGRIVYFDIFGKQRVTGFCLEGYTIDGNSLRWEIANTTSLNYQK